jgi:hypothetical protein
MVMMELKLTSMVRLPLRTLAGRIGSGSVKADWGLFEF